MENNDNYCMKALIKRFDSHHQNYLKQHKEICEKYPEREKLFDDEFSLPFALKTICEAILFIYENPR